MREVPPQQRSTSTHNKLSRYVTWTLLWIFCVPVAAAVPPGPSDIDRQLLEELDAVDEPLDPQLDQPPADAGRKPGTDSQTTNPQESLDQQLLQQLDEGEDVPLAADEGEVANLGEDVDPVTRIGEKMRLVERLLAQQTLQQRTGQLQNEIVRDLAELLKKLQQQQQQQQQQAQSRPQAQSRQQASRRKIQQPRQQMQPKPGNRQSTKPADQSEERVRKAQPQQVDTATVAEIIKQIWGHLPEKERERLRQMAADQPLPESSLQIEKYFRRLAEAEDR